MFCEWPQVVCDDLATYAYKTAAEGASWSNNGIFPAVKSQRTLDRSDLKSNLIRPGEEPERGHHQKAAPAIKIRMSRLASISRTASRNMRLARKKIIASATTPNTATVIAMVIKKRLADCWPLDTNRSFYSLL